MDSASTIETQFSSYTGGLGQTCPHASRDVSRYEQRRGDSRKRLSYVMKYCVVTQYSYMTTMCGYCVAASRTPLIGPRRLTSQPLPKKCRKCLHLLGRFPIPCDWFVLNRYIFRVKPIGETYAEDGVSSGSSTSNRVVTVNIAKPPPISSQQRLFSHDPAHESPIVFTSGT